MPILRSATSTSGRNMAGARALWRATGMGDDDFGKPIVAIANSFTQFVPGHVHLKDMGQLVAGAIEEAGGVGKEFDTIAVDGTKIHANASRTQNRGYRELAREEAHVSALRNSLGVAGAAVAGVGLVLFGMPEAVVVVPAATGAGVALGHRRGVRQYRDMVSKGYNPFDYAARGCRIEADEIFISDGSKCDCGNILDIFGDDNKIAITDPVYPVYVDTNVMAGHTGPADESDDALDPAAHCSSASTPRCGRPPIWRWTARASTRL